MGASTHGNTGSISIGTGEALDGLTGGIRMAVANGHSGAGGSVRVLAGSTDASGSTGGGSGGGSSAALAAFEAPLAIGTVLKETAPAVTEKFVVLNDAIPLDEIVASAVVASTMTRAGSTTSIKTSLGSTI